MEKKTQNRIIHIFCALVFLLLAPNVSSAATMSLVPTNSTYSVGDRAVIRIVVSSDVPLNAVSGAVSFPTSIFSIESVSKAGSILNFWVTEPSLSKTNGMVQFEGVATSPFLGSNGTVVTVVLRATKEGTGTVSFGSGQILANDGQGTDITSGLNKGTFVVTPAKIIEKPKPAEPAPAPEPVPEVETPKPVSTNAPEINLGKQDGLLSIVGTSKYPKSDVVLTFISASNSKIFISGTTDTSGGFNIIVPQVLVQGPYTVNAVVLLSDGSHTRASNTLVVEVGTFFEKYMVWFLFLIILLLIAYLVYRQYFTHNKTRNLLRKEVREAEEVVHKSFKILRKDIDNGDLKKDLDGAEEAISKHIEDIESVPLDGDK